MKTTTYPSRVLTARRADAVRFLSLDGGRLRSKRRRVFWGKERRRLMNVKFGTLGNKMIDLGSITAQTILDHQEEIAHALENICRYAGHVHEHHSVASHSCLVAAMIPELSTPEATCKARLLALLHDIGEVFVGDIPAPLQHHLRNHDESALQALHAFENAVLSAACDAFFPKSAWPRDDAVLAAVDIADKQAVIIERAIYQMEVFSSHGKPPKIDYERGDWLRAVQGEAQELEIIKTGLN